jgi:hypothetical protein
VSVIRRLLRRFLAATEPVRWVNHRPAHYRRNTR